MIQVTTSFIQNIFGTEPIKGNKSLEQRFDQVLYLFKGTYPSMKSGDHSATMALSAMGFVVNAEVYFDKIEPKNGREFFLAKRNDFLKYYNFEAILESLRKGDQMLFLYEPLSAGTRKLSSHGVIGKFHSIEHYCHDNPQRGYTDDPDPKPIVVRLELGNKGIIDLPVVDLAYFGSWTKKLELIM